MAAKFQGGRKNKTGRYTLFSVEDEIVLHLKEISFSYISIVAIVLCVNTLEISVKNYNSLWLQFGKCCTLIYIFSLHSLLVFSA